MVKKIFWIVIIFSTTSIWALILPGNSTHAGFFGLQTGNSTFVSTPTTDPVERAAYCIKTNNKIDNAIDGSDNRISKHARAVERKKDSFKQKLDNLERYHCDTRQLRKDQVKLNQLYDQWENHWENNYKLYLADLKDTKQYSCVDNSSDFDQTLKVAKTQFKLMKEEDKKDKKAVYSFLKKTFQPDIKALFCQK